MNDLKYWVAFSYLSEIGSARFQKLLNYFKSLEKAWTAGVSELEKAGIENKIAERIILKRKQINPDEKMEKCEKENIRVITFNDPQYPKLLKEINSFPALLFYKGNFQRQDEFSLAIIGTRKMSLYGKQIIVEIIRDLVQTNLVIVSGLARGVDTLAHQITLEFAGRTIAVLGSGLNEKNIYPFENKALAQKIVEQNGLLLSEYPPETFPQKYFFPYRNRIVAGLTLGTLVIEAPERSGALITARYALEQGREIFAVPGNVHSLNSVGCNNLIKMGGKLVNNANDILDALNFVRTVKPIVRKVIKPSNKEEAELLKYLSEEPIHVDKLIEFSKLSPTDINSVLTMMEINGKIKHLGGMYYILG
ncbi:DNA-protecting protein DprA [Candidatus Kuenenbacteria bacterium HGW-Kuenenbacteria-1]|uniref:DNA-protecting protein DprA n=1 Tax=Candidatus Kuenenbacteria bacterium HGW-Kuenenbacteria-1 TaxID=2013812 RepID=A0A2N1UP87_9BACT|nr:MAG: DNA-protecting protein DprA [Candidatus Kuenenbacteria bacterium HGW-Kuenenbacteria-1]